MQTCNSMMVLCDSVSLHQQKCHLFPRARYCAIIFPSATRCEYEFYSSTIGIDRKSTDHAINERDSIFSRSYFYMHNNSGFGLVIQYSFLTYQDQQLQPIQRSKSKNTTSGARAAFNNNLLRPILSTHR